MRVLLLARGAGDWWTALLKASSEVEAWLGVTPPYELEPLAGTEADRAAVFREAAEEFARRQGKRYEPQALPPLSDRRFERVLYLHMAALAAVEGLRFEAHNLMAVILDHEERFWDAGDWQSEARQLVAAATLHGGLTTHEVARRVAQRVLGRPASDESEKLLKLLHLIYRRGGEEFPVFLPALEPDLLGEGLVLRVAERALSKQDLVPDDWIHRVLPADEEPVAIKNALEVLGRASAREPEAARGWIREILSGPLRPRVYLALQAALAVGQRTALSVLGDELAGRLEAGGDVALARELEAAVIPHRTVSLRRVAEWTARTLLNGLPATGDDLWQAERARLLNNLGMMLRELGQSEEALKAMEQAVDTYGALAQRKPEAFQPDLAMSLNNLGGTLSNLDRREEALKATKQAVEAFRALAQRNPEAFQPYLAMSLINLGGMLSELDLREEALKAAEQAVETYEVLARRNFEVFQPYLAMSLNNLGLRLSELDRIEEGLRAMEQAVETYGVMAEKNPEAFQPDLAMSLNNLGTVLRKLGRREEALKATEQAVETYRALAQRTPEAFQPYLAMSLNNICGTLVEFDRTEEALAICEEAIGRLRPFFERNPLAFERRIATLLTNVLKLCEAFQRPIPPKIQECVDLFKRLTKRCPASL